MEDKEFRIFGDLQVAGDGEVILVSGKHTYGYKISSGYRAVHYKGKNYLVHRLVAECFLNGGKPIDPRVYAVHHINENPEDNRVENLLILTHEEHTALHKKDNQYWKGRHHTEEAKKKLSEYHKGLHLTEETKKKLSILNTGKKHPNFGKRGSEANGAKAIIGVHKVTGEVVEFGSIIDAERTLGITSKNIDNNLHGRSKSAGGFKWHYA